MSERLIELRLWRQFLALADALHFGRAAERLHMTQPPLTQAIAHLEGLLGVRLFERDKQGFESPSLDEEFLGLITLLIVPVQVLLIAFAMRGFQQAWNVEEEVPGSRDTYSRPPQQGAPATA